MGTMTLLRLFILAVILVSVGQAYLLARYLLWPRICRVTHCPWCWQDAGIERDFPASWSSTICHYHDCQLRTQYMARRLTGYGQPGAATQLDRLMREKQILLLDVRLVPHSRWDVGWNRATLAARYGERYRWEPRLGNLRYGERSSAIALATGNQEAIREAAQLLCHGTSLILLCVCAKARDCHCLLVAKLIQEALPGLSSPWEARR